MQVEGGPGSVDSSVTFMVSAAKCLHGNLTRASAHASCVITGWRWMTLWYLNVWPGCLFWGQDGWAQGSLPISAQVM